MRSMRERTAEREPIRLPGPEGAANLLINVPGSEPDIRTSLVAAKIGKGAIRADCFRRAILKWLRAPMASDHHVRLPKRQSWGLHLIRRGESTQQKGIEVSLGIEGVDAFLPF